MKNFWIKIGFIFALLNFAFLSAEAAKIGRACSAELSVHTRFTTTTQDDRQFLRESQQNFNHAKKVSKNIFDFKIPEMARSELQSAVLGIDHELKTLETEKLSDGQTEAHRQLLQKHIQLLETVKIEMQNLLSTEDISYSDYAESLLRGNSYFGLFKEMNAASYKNKIESAQKDAQANIDLLYEILRRLVSREKMSGVIFLTSQPREIEHLAFSPFTGVFHVQVIFDRKNLLTNFKDSNHFAKHDIFHANSGIDKLDWRFEKWFNQFTSDLSKEPEELQLGVTVYFFDYFHERNSSSQKISNFPEFIKLWVQSTFDIMSLAQDTGGAAYDLFGERTSQIVPKALKWLDEYLKQHPIDQN